MEYIFDFAESPNQAARISKIPHIYRKVSLIVKLTVLID